MNQEELRGGTGVSQGHFSYIERGEKEIGADILLRISEEFEKSIEWLLTGKE
jgi:transcriptional regulator with XRE-family HTH domain